MVNHTLKKLGGHALKVGANGLTHSGSIDDDLGEVLVEDIANNLDQQVGFAVQEDGRLALVDLARDGRPLRAKAIDVVAQLLFRGTLGGGANDNADVLGKHLFEDLLESETLGFGKLAADAVHGVVGHVNEVATGERHLRGEACTLVADRILGHLHENFVTRLQREFNSA